MKNLAFLLLAGSALVSPALAQSSGTPFGTVCPVSLPLGTPFANTASAPTGTTLNIWDGTQCVPWATLNQTAHSISITAAPAGAALTRTNDTNVTLTLGGTPATALLQATSITAGWAGTLAVARGGTGGGTASGTLLDNISGLSGTGFLTRTGAGTYAFQSATNGVTLGNLAQSGANTMLGNWTGSTANVAANAMPSCTDSGGNHLNYVSGTGVTCGTATGAAAAGSLTGTTLASNVVTSSLTTVGTIGTGVWNGTGIDVAHGGTGRATLTNHGVVVGAGTSGTNATGPAATGQVMISQGVSADPIFSATPTLTNVLLPSGGGTVGQIATSGGGGSNAMTWSTMGAMRACAVGVNFNVANTDTALTLLLPSTKWVGTAIKVGNASASISTATVGIFTGAGGTGQTLAANQAITVTQSAADTVNNTMGLTQTNQTTMAYTDTTLQVRVGTAQGSAATADVCVYYFPL